ncbi:MAG: LPP20 family lipoprotein [Campylobacterota bacterium]|nr:LPP20 family lipoprotein [Campylobacterota bacterium]
MRKYRDCLVVAMMAGALLFTGCSDKDPEVEANEDFECRIAGALAPTWTCGSSNIDGYITAVGSAPLSKIGHGFSRREALANGRSNLSQQIETLVKDKVETFARSTGIGGDEVADKVSTQVSKQVAKVTLKGSKQIKYWENPSNSDIYLLVSISQGELNQEIKNQVVSSYKNSDALWQQFQSKNALESLEKEFQSQ